MNIQLTATSNKRVKSFLMVFLLWGTVLYGQSDFVSFERAKEHFIKGLVFYNRMRYLAAVEHFRKAVEIYPSYHTARDYLSRSYQFAGYSSESLKELQYLYSMSKNVDVKSRIDSIRFRNSGVTSGNAIDHLVLNKTYASVNFKQNSFYHPTDAVVDHKGNLYISSFSEGRIVKLDTNGKVLNVFRPALGGMLTDMDLKGEILAVTDFKNDSVYITDLQGTVLLKVGGSGSKPGLFHGPWGVSLGKNSFYVVDSGNQRVQKFNSKGTFVLSFGKPGSYEGELKEPTGIFTDDSYVYVTDTGNRRISVFDHWGNFSRSISIEGMKKPTGITGDGTRLFVADREKGLAAYSLVSGSTEWFTSWNDGRESFNILTGALFDRDGNLYCVDHGKHSIFLFSPETKIYSNLQVEVTAVDASNFPTIAFYLNIRDKNGLPVYGLQNANFHVVEDSAPIHKVSVNYMKKLRPSLSMVFCVDRSLESKKFHRDIPWAGSFLLNEMYKNDRVKVVNFNKDYWQGAPFDWSPRRSKKALDALEYRKGKAVGRTLYNALTDLIPRFSRRAVVLFTDGSLHADSFAGYSEEVVVDYARAHYIPIYIISFSQPDPVLVRIAKDTGGEILRPGDISAIKNLYTTLKKSEEYRYLLLYSTFKSSALKGLWSDVTVKVDYKSQTGKLHAGYFVPQ